MEWLESLILGIVQGITEFLPVSSDGHLVVTQKLFAWLSGQSRSGEENLFFDVMLHVGTLGAILFHYRKEIFNSAHGFLTGTPDVPPGFDRGAVWRIGLLAIVATLPLIPLKLFFIDWIKETFKSERAAGIGFLITASVLLLTTWRLARHKGRKGLAQTTWLDALVIGLAQMFAPLPGVSRSGLTVASALARGFSPTWAVGFSLLIAVPAISGAALSELKDALANPQTLGLTPVRLGQTVAATVVAGLVGYFAILWLIRIVRGGRLWYFSVYLIILGTLVLAVSALSGGSTDEHPAQALDWTTGSRDPGPAARSPGDGSRRPLDRTHGTGPRPGCRGLGVAADGRSACRTGVFLG